MQILHFYLVGSNTLTPVDKTTFPVTEKPSTLKAVCKIEKRRKEKKKEREREHNENA